MGWYEIILPGKHNGVLSDFALHKAVFRSSKPVFPKLSVKTYLRSQLGLHLQSPCQPATKLSSTEQRRRAHTYVSEIWISESQKGMDADWLIFNQAITWGSPGRACSQANRQDIFFFWETFENLQHIAPTRRSLPANRKGLAKNFGRRTISVIPLFYITNHHHHDHHRRRRRHHRHRHRHRHRHHHHQQLLLTIWKYGGPFWLLIMDPLCIFAITIQYFL